MKRRIRLTIDVNCNDDYFGRFKEINKINVSTVLSKYNYSILRNTELERLDLVAKEINATERDILVGYAAHDLKEIIYLKDKILFEVGSYTIEVYIPNKERFLETKN